MTAPTITAPQLALARTAAEAALAVLPTSRALLVADPVAASADILTEGQAVTAKFSGAAAGEVVVVVGQDLADALKESPLGELDLTAAVRPALEAAARVFGPVVLDPGVVMEPGVALSAEPMLFFSACRHTPCQICRGLISPKCRCGESRDVPCKSGRLRLSV